MTKENDTNYHIELYERLKGKVTRGRNLCLTLWQPWASLMVVGIKKAEGRGWYSTHRGRLWIHAASRQPSIDEIKALEYQYRDCGIPFPTEYPTSALLGCVNVDDVLSQQDYQLRFAEEEREENGSDFIFVCSQARQLRMPIPLSGQHKIWKLDKTLLDTAEMTLL
jgi:hypothetical protein